MIGWKTSLVLMALGAILGLLLVAAADLAPPAQADITARVVYDGTFDAFVQNDGPEPPHVPWPEPGEEMQEQYPDCYEQFISDCWYAYYQYLIDYHDRCTTEKCRLIALDLYISRLALALANFYLCAQGFDPIVVPE